jgi:polar amino acid transport system permease protein
MLFSGVVGLVVLWGLRTFRTSSHLVALALYIIGPIIVLGLPRLEVLNYPISTAARLQIAWPLVIMAVWYVLLDYALMREPVEVTYQAPADASLSEQLVISQRTAKTRFGILGFAVWVGLLVALYSLLMRFDLDIAFMGHFLRFIMGGATLTVLVSACSIVLAIILALLGALGRLSTNPIANGVSGFYISLIRGTPLLVQIFIWYLGLPRLGIILDPVVAGILALGVNYGAYMTEIFRAGIQAVSIGQREAASALGMSGGQTFRKIILPQAFRIVIPPIGNQFIAMMKDSSLVMVMGVWELTFRAKKIGNQNFRNLETFLIAAGFYWILTVIFQLLQGKLEEHMARGERR